MVGVCAALALQDRGRAVVLIDRRAKPGCETSFGNAGLIERSSVFPYMFPRDWRVFWRYARNAAPEAHYDIAALPTLLPWLFRYYRNSSPARAAAIARAALPLIESSVVEHEAFARRAGVFNLLRRTGWMKLYRSERTFASALAETEKFAAFSVSTRALDNGAVKIREPALCGSFAGAIEFADTLSVADPGALVAAYAEVFRREGGSFQIGDARRLTNRAETWSITCESGEIRADDVVVALGPWSDAVFRRLGYRIPLAVKRGYHIHFAPLAGAELRAPLLDVEGGYVLSPMRAGTRMTTGAEFALRDAPPSPVQIAQTEPLARALIPLGARIEAQPWMGARPCLPDMLPVIGPAPGRAGLWFAFGHQHHGFTQGPASARLLAEMMTGDEPFADPRPFRADRF